MSATEIPPAMAEVTSVKTGTPTTANGVSRYRWQGREWRVPPALGPRHQLQPRNGVDEVQATGYEGPGDGPVRVGVDLVRSDDEVQDARQDAQDHASPSIHRRILSVRGTAGSGSPTTPTEGSGWLRQQTPDADPVLGVES